MLTAVHHYQELAHQAQKDVFTEEIGRALNHLSLCLIYSKDCERDLEIAIKHIHNAQATARDL